MADEVCAACGKNAERLTVHEGDKRFHLDCYVIQKISARRFGIPARGG